MKNEKEKGYVPQRDRPTIELVPQDYQPSKAELEADLRIKGTFEQGIKALLWPVKIRRVKPKRTRS